MDLFIIFCPECGERAADEPPTNYITPSVRPRYSHLSDGTALCPVISAHGYVPAEAVEHVADGA